MFISVLAMAGYSAARLHFPGRDFLFAVPLFTIVVPPKTIMLSLFTYYAKVGWNNTFIALILPAWLGFGVRGAILLFIYRQFFRGLPYELEDAAYADGAGPSRTFWQIMLSLTMPAVLVVMLSSLVWTWNDHFLPELILIAETTYTCEFRGNTLVDISPRREAPSWETVGQDDGVTSVLSRGYPIYARDHMKGDRAPMREVTRYVSYGII